MEDVLVWLFWAAIIVGSIVSSASKAKKKQEEARRAAEAARRAAEARRSVEARGSAGRVAPTQALGSGTASGPARQDVKPVGGTFGRILEELSRQLSEQPSPPVASRPIATSEPEATSHDYYSLEDDWDADSRQSAEEFDAERRYVGGEMRASSFATRYDYEHLTTEPARRSSIEAVKIATDESADTAMSVDSPDSLVSPDAAVTPITLRELLGGDFDLRRAVIEAEILTPKYISHN